MFPWDCCPGAKRKLDIDYDTPVIIPSNVGTVLNCSPVNVDLQEYIKEDRFTLRLLTTTDETIPENVHVNVYTNFRVDAKLLK